MRDRTEISAPVVGDLVEIVAPGCGPAGMCGCELHALVGHRGRVERIETSATGVLDLYHVAGTGPAWFADELRVVERPSGPRYRPLGEVRSADLRQVLEVAQSLGWRVAGVVVEPTWTDIPGAEDETARLHPPTEDGTLYLFATAAEALGGLLRIRDNSKTVTTTTCGTEDVLRCVRAHGLVDLR